LNRERAVFMKKKIALVLLTVLLISVFAFSVTGCVSYREIAGSGKEKGSVDLTLRFDEQGNFKILQMTDIQFLDYIDDDSLAVMSATIDFAKPDLIVITGDQISPEYLGGQSGKARKIIRQITGFFDSKEIPWTLCFGNHDGAMGVLSKKSMLEEYQKSAYFIGGFDESKYYESYINEKEDTYCNFFLPVYSNNGESVEYGVFIMDCATSLFSPYVGYSQGQIDFYNAMTQKYGVRMSMYTHEPTQEFQTMYDNRDNAELVSVFKGEIESPENGKAYYPTKNPEMNEAFKNSLIANKNVDGIYAGHDHMSNFAGIYKIADDYNIVLGFGRMSSYGFGEWRYFMTSASKRKEYKNYPRGGRVVAVTENSGYSTYEVLDNKDGNYTMTTRYEITK
ncbi:MAG: metallophosphoesterase, partial [Clostridia bacterium]|nr:metallophosphoesterase [Clostridia bacterium]